MNDLVVAVVLVGVDGVSHSEGKEQRILSNKDSARYQNRPVIQRE